MHLENLINKSMYNEISLMYNEGSFKHNEISKCVLKNTRKSAWHMCK